MSEIPEEFDELETEEFEDEEDEFEIDDEPVVDPNRVITLRTTGGQSRYIPAEEPMPLSEVKNLSGLAFGAVTFYMNAAVIGDNEIIPVGGVVTAIGNVKGG